MTFSMPWKRSVRFFRTVEKRGPIFPRRGKKFSTAWKTPEPRWDAKRGAALVVALWTVLILSLLIGAMAYEMHVEAGITSYARKRMKAQVAARGGVEYAKFLLAKSYDVSAFEGEDEEQEALRTLAKNLSRGIGVSGGSAEQDAACAQAGIEALGLDRPA